MCGGGGAEPQACPRLGQNQRKTQHHTMQARGRGGGGEGDGQGGFQPEKVKVLHSMKVVAPEDVVLGQYKARGKNPGYLDDQTVPKGRCAPPQWGSYGTSLLCARGDDLRATCQRLLDILGSWHSACVRNSLIGWYYNNIIYY